MLSGPWLKAVNRRRKAGVFLVVAILAGLAGFNFNRAKVIYPAAEGAAWRLMSVSLPDLDGKLQSLSQWRGKVLVLNFWATWCAPCREEMPLLDRTQQRLANKGLQIVGIANDSAAATKEFLGTVPVRYPILIDDPDKGEDLSELFGNARDVLPYTVLIGRDGRILARRPGNFSETALDAWLTPHL